MQANDLIRAKRIEKGLSPDMLSEQSGMTASEYADVEQHADEIFTTVPAAKVKRLCTALDLPLEAILQVSPFANDLRDGGPQDIRVQRELLGLSTAEVAEAIGFEEAAVLKGEEQREYLDSLPIEVLAAWAKAIGVGVDALTS